MLYTIQFISCFMAQSAISHINCYITYILYSTRYDKACFIAPPVMPVIARCVVTVASESGARILAAAARRH